ncbi:hypothetical protein Tco_0934921 [Tanacetum coccineum]
MITPTDQEPAQEVKHIWWDVYNCESCLDEAAKIDDDEDLPKKQKSSQQKLKRSQAYLSSRIRSLESIINELHFKIQELHREIIQIIQTSPTTQPSSSISQKEAEMKNLKNQLQDLERQHKQKRITSFIDDPWRLPSTPFVELQYYTIDVVIKRFLTRLQGRLKDWYHSLSEYRQLQIQQSISPEAFMSIIYSEFIGNPWEHTAHAREEFLKMKCCSF